jgi:proteasome alpha subunit
MGTEYRAGMGFNESLKVGAKALSASDPNRELDPQKLEVAVLDRARPRRTFRRLEDADVVRILAGSQ